MNPKFLIWLLAGRLVLIRILSFRFYSLKNASNMTTTAIAPQVTQSSNLWAMFLTDLFVGGLTCRAVQGGLLAVTIAQREEEQCYNLVLSFL